MQATNNNTVAVSYFYELKYSLLRERAVLITLMKIRKLVRLKKIIKLERL